MLHIHFGVGRLGLGLVAPFFKTSNSELFLLNRAVSRSNATGSTALDPDRRNPLLADNPDRRYVIKSPSGREVVDYDEFFAYESDEHLEQIVASIIERSDQKQHGVLVTASVLKVSNYGSVVRALNAICDEKEHGDSSIGPVYLVACENTVNAADVFMDDALSELVSEETRCHVVPVHALVDRVCMGLEEDTSTRRPMVLVRTEDYGSLKLQLCDKSEPLRDALEDSRAEFTKYVDVEKQIKSWMLNGTHWLLALRAYAAVEFSDTHADARDMQLNKYLKASPENWQFAETVMDEMRQGVSILLQGDPAYADFCRDVNVEDYLTGAAAKILERFAAADDPIKRILARFRAPTPQEHKSIEAFNARFAGRVDGPMLAYESVKGTIPPASSRSIFSLHRLLASGAYVTAEQ